MIIKEVIQRIQSLYSKGVQSDDSRLTYRHIYNKITSVRARLIREKYNKKNLNSAWSYQLIPCVKLIKASTIECPCLPPKGCEILRSEEPLPEFISHNRGHIIKSVSSVDGSIVYSETTWDEYKFKKYQKYTNNKPDFFIRNNYLYLTYKSGPRIISIEALFEDPIEADIYANGCCDEENAITNYPEDCGADCEPYYDKDFHIEESMVDTLVQMSLQELIEVFGNAIEDISNNTVDSQQRIK